MNFKTIKFIKEANVSQVPQIYANWNQELTQAYNSIKRLSTDEFDEKYEDLMDEVDNQDTPELNFIKTRSVQDQRIFVMFYLMDKVLLTRIWRTPLDLQELIAKHTPMFLVIQIYREWNLQGRRKMFEIRKGYQASFQAFKVVSQTYVKPYGNHEDRRILAAFIKRLHQYSKRSKSKVLV